MLSRVVRWRALEEYRTDFGRVGEPALGVGLRGPRRRDSPSGDVTGRLEVFLHQERRDGEHRPDRVEAIAGVVCWKGVGHSERDADEVTNRAAVLAPVQPAQHHVARGGLCGIEAEDVVLNEPHESRPLVRRGLRFIRWRHRAGPHVAPDRLPRMVLRRVGHGPAPGERREEGVKIEAAFTAAFGVAVGAGLTKDDRGCGPGRLHREHQRAANGGRRNAGVEPGAEGRRANHASLHQGPGGRRRAGLEGSYRQMVTHSCPVISRIISTGYDRCLARMRRFRPEVPVKAVFFQTA